MSTYYLDARFVPYWDGILLSIGTKLSNIVLEDNSTHHSAILEHPCLFTFDTAKFGNEGVHLQCVHLTTLFENTDSRVTLDPAMFAPIIHSRGSLFFMNPEREKSGVCTSSMWPCTVQLVGNYS